MEAFEDDIGVFGSLDIEQLVLYAPSLYEFGKWVLTNLTLELCEVVRNGCLFLLADDLRLDPLLEAVQVDYLAGSLTVTGRNEEIVLELLVAQADLADPLQRLGNLVLLLNF